MFCLLVSHNGIHVKQNEAILNLYSEQETWYNSVTEPHLLMCSASLVNLFLQNQHISIFKVARVKCLTLENIYQNVLASSSASSNLNRDIFISYPWQLMDICNTFFNFFLSFTHIYHALGFLANIQSNSSLWSHFCSRDGNL